jgi:hypothetical protein
MRSLHCMGGAGPASLGRRNVMRFGGGPLLQSRRSLTVQ